MTSRIWKSSGDHSKMDSGLPENSHNFLARMFPKPGIKLRKRQACRRFIKENIKFGALKYTNINIQRYHFRE